MNTLVVFVMFWTAKLVSTESWLSSCRERRAMRPEDVVELLETATVKLAFFHTLLDDEWAEDDRLFRLRRSSSLAENARKVLSELQRMSRQFVSVSYVYTTVYMNNYFRLAGRYLDANKVSSKRAVDSLFCARDVLGPYYDQGFCVLTAFHDCGIDVDRVFETIFRSQSTASGIKDELGPRITLKSQFGAYEEITDCKRLLRLPAVPHVQRAKRALESLEKPSKKSLFAVKRAMVEFLDRFCSRWTPVVPPFRLSKRPAIDYRKHPSTFVRHVFEKETCKVLSSWIDPLWNCDMIMQLRDYGSEKYEDSVTVEQVMERETPNVDKRRLYSLGTLRDKLIDEPASYRNVVQYDDVASTVLLLFSIREGEKILKGIRRAVKDNCVVPGKVVYVLKNEGAQTVVRHLRSTLTAFKTVFDRLVDLMLRKKRVNVSHDRHKKAFDRRVDTVAKWLDIRHKRTANWPAIQDNLCAGILNLLGGPDYDAYYGDNAYSAVRFFEFYLTAPILNINQLYRFYANEYS